MLYSRKDNNVDVRKYNLLLFFFLLLLKMYREIKDGWNAHARAEVGIFCETSSGFDQKLPGYIIFWMPFSRATHII